MTPYQPYARQVERPQTPALAAMLLGRPTIGANPIDQWRQLQRGARRPRTLLDLLMSR